MAQDLELRRSQGRMVSSETGAESRVAPLPEPYGYLGNVQYLGIRIKRLAFYLDRVSVGASLSVELTPPPDEDNTSVRRLGLPLLLVQSLVGSSLDSRKRQGEKLSLGCVRDARIFMEERFAI